MIVFSDKIVYDRRITSICLEELFFLSDACAADHSGEKEGRVMEAIFWLGAVIVLVIIEIATLGLTTIWFAGGALVACIAALCHANLLAQVLLFLGVSILLLVFTRPAAVRFMNKDRIKTNAESLVGEEAVVLQEISNLKAQGTVHIKGLEWTARTADNKDTIEKGAVVLVEKIDGVKLIVRRKEG